MPSKPTTSTDVLHRSPPPDVGSCTSTISRPPFASPQRTISFHVEEPPLETSPTPRWSPEQEERLLRVERELERAQRKWSDSQQIWIEQVEGLRELKRRSEKFHRRRSKISQKERTTFLHEARRQSTQSSAGSSDSEGSTVASSRPSTRKSGIFDTIRGTFKPRTGVRKGQCEERDSDGVVRPTFPERKDSWTIKTRAMCLNGFSTWSEGAD